MLLISESVRHFVAPAIRLNAPQTASTETMKDKAHVADAEKTKRLIDPPDAKEIVTSAEAYAVIDAN